MATKLQADSAREPFRPKFVVDDVARITRDDKIYDYKLVIYNYRHDPLTVEKHEKAGFEVVYSTEHIQDDRKFSPGAKSEEDRLRPAPVLKTTNDGFKQVLMRRLKTESKAYALKKAKEEDIKHRRSVKKMTKANGQIDIDDGEVDLNNPTEEHNDE